jgi:hypothetical protein
MSRLTAACVLGFCVLLGAAPASAAPRRELPGLAPTPQDALTRALESGRLTEAGYALARARTLFELHEVRDEFVRVTAPSARSATAILRDLFLRRSALRGEEARVAARILARPRANEHQCDAERPLCFHWGNQVSDQEAAQTAASFAAVYDLEVRTYGFLRPLRDGSRGGNSKTDIYIEDIGPDFFGYCTSDDPSPTPDVPAYCVVDDDFAEFGQTQTPEKFRDITAAHEYFHAIQFRYDSNEDWWFMEGTAMLMEGQFRPTVLDRVRYLADSVLTSPGTPVDFGANGFDYGSWIYWRFLVEDFGELGNPLVIRQIWERAAGARTDTDGPGPDTVSTNPYSLKATRLVIGARGRSFRDSFGKFTRVNRVPTSFYEEGAEYPAAPVARRRTMSEGETTGWRSTALHHLASASFRFTPAVDLDAETKLRFAVDLPRRDFGPVARVVVLREDGTFHSRTIELDWTGGGSRSLDFGSDVARVDLILTNASTRMNCWRNTRYSCAGVGLDDLRSYRYRVSVR